MREEAQERVDWLERSNQELQRGIERNTMTAEFLHPCLETVSRIVQELKDTVPQEESPSAS